MVYDFTSDILRAEAYDVTTRLSTSWSVSTEYCLQ
jgi:hypothetical protein